MVMDDLPWAAYSGMYSATRSAMCSSPRSSSRWASVAVIALEAEKMTNGVSGVASAAPSLRRDQPTARSRTTRPRWRTQSATAG